MHSVSKITFLFTIKVFTQTLANYSSMMPDSIFSLNDKVHQISPHGHSLKSSSANSNKNETTKFLTTEAMETKIKMMMGIGGTSLVTFANEKTAVIMDGTIYKCLESQESVDGNCGDKFHEMHLDTLENLCYLKPFKVIRDFTCLSIETPFTFEGNRDNNIICRSDKSAGTPILLPTENYDKICSEFGHGKFVYYPDTSGSDSVELPLRNPFVTCLNRPSKDFCKFTF